MASINFTNLKNTGKNSEKYTYTDLFLDLTENVVGISSDYVKTNGSGRDIKVAYNLNAIRNSLTNLFNTIPGERFLLPEYGADLRKYIFEPITDMTGRQIGRSIQRSIANWEPRVKILGLNITGYVDRNEYQIDLILSIPFLNEKLNLTGIFKKEGFLIV